MVIPFWYFHFHVLGFFHFFKTENHVATSLQFFLVGEVRWCQCRIFGDIFMGSYHSLWFWQSESDLPMLLEEYVCSGLEWYEVLHNKEKKESACKRSGVQNITSLMLVISKRFSKDCSLCFLNPFISSFLPPKILILYSGIYNKNYSSLKAKYLFWGQRFHVWTQSLIQHSIYLKLRYFKLHSIRFKRWQLSIQWTRKEKHPPQNTKASNMNGDSIKNQTGFSDFTENPMKHMKNWSSF